jgi:hypothetical protein
MRTTRTSITATNTSRGASPANDRLAKADQIAERVDRAHLQRAPRRPFEAGTHVAILFGADLAVEFFDAAHHHAQPRARRAVAMVLAEVQDQVAARHLAVKRSVVVEAMIPVDLEAEKAQIELVGLGDRGSSSAAPISAGSTTHSGCARPLSSPRDREPSASTPRPARGPSGSGARDRDHAGQRAGARPAARGRKPRPAAGLRL